ncbi:MAG: hypothetical protein AB7K09_02620 [Planctomycetota bacterium]
MFANRPTRHLLLILAVLVVQLAGTSCKNVEIINPDAKLYDMDLSVPKSSSATFGKGQFYEALYGYPQNLARESSTIDLVDFEVVTVAPQHGSIMHTDASLTYTPTPGYVGTDEFVLRVRFSSGAVADVRIHVTVNSTFDCKTGVWTNLGALGDAARGAIEKVRTRGASRFRSTGSGPDDAVVVTGVQNADAMPMQVGPGVNMDLAPGADPGTGTITRNDAGDFTADDYRVGTRISISGSGAGNDTFGAIVNVITVAATQLVVDAALAVENSSAIALTGTGGEPSTFFQTFDSVNGLSSATFHLITPAEALQSYEAQVSDAPAADDMDIFRVGGAGAWISDPVAGPRVCTEMLPIEELFAYAGTVDTDFPRVFVPSDARVTGTRVGPAGQSLFAFYQRKDTEPTDPSDLFIRTRANPTDMFSAATRVFDINPATDTVLIANTRFSGPDAAWALALVNTPGGLQSWMRVFANGTWGALKIVAGSATMSTSSDGTTMAVRTNPLDSSIVESSYYTPGNDTWVDLTAIDASSAVSQTLFLPTLFDHPVRGLDLPFNHNGFDRSRLIVRCSNQTVRETTFDAVMMAWTTDVQIYDSTMGAGGSLIGLNVFPSRFNDHSMFITQDDGAGDNQLWHQRLDPSTGMWSTPVRVDDTAVSGVGVVQFSSLYGESRNGDGILTFTDNNGQTLFGSFFDGATNMFSSPQALSTNPVQEHDQVADNNGDGVVVWRENDGAGTDSVHAVLGLADVWQSPTMLKQVAGTITFNMDVDINYRAGKAASSGSFTTTVTLTSGGAHEVHVLHD